MKFVPTAISRKVADQALLGRKHSPTILFGVGVASMVGSTVLACRATLQLSESLHRTKHDLDMAKDVHEKAPEKYNNTDYRKDVAVVWTRGVLDVTRLYAPAVLVGGLGVACLTKSHQILQERNAALTAAYIAVDKAFQAYRERVIDRYGEDADRELRYHTEEIDVIDEDTGEVLSIKHVAPGDQGLYARWFDLENNNWSAAPMDEYNWMFLRNQQNWANDMLKARGHLFLNEVYSMLGLSHTSAGAAVGWVYKRDNEVGDNYVDFGCWDQKDNPDPFFNGRDGAILLDFNVDGPIWQLIDELRESS